MSQHPAKRHPHDESYAPGRKGDEERECKHLRRSGGHKHQPGKRRKPECPPATYDEAARHEEACKRRHHDVPGRRHFNIFKHAVDERGQHEGEDACEDKTRGHHTFDRLLAGQRLSGSRGEGRPDYRDSTSSGSAASSEPNVAALLHRGTRSSSRSS
jgi:hypothetical protein